MPSDRIALVALYFMSASKLLSLLNPTNPTNPSNIKQQTTQNRSKQKTPKDAEGPSLVADIGRLELT